MYSSEFPAFLPITFSFIHIFKHDSLLNGLNTNLSRLKYPSLFLFSLIFDSSLGKLMSNFLVRRIAHGIPDSVKKQ